MKTEQMKTIYHHAMEQLPLDGLEGRTLEKLSSAKDKKRDFPAKRIAAAAAAVMLLCATGALILSQGFCTLYAVRSKRGKQSELPGESN